MPRVGMMHVTSSVPQASNRKIFSSIKQKSHLRVAFLRISVDMPKDKENQKRLAREWYLRNKEKAIERAKKWAQENPERRYEIHRKNREKDRENHNRRNRDWNSRNQHIKTALEGKRRAAKLLRTPKWLTQDDLFILEEAYHLAKLRSQTTGIQYHVDHILPLQGKKVSGLHTPNNIQVIPAKINLQKSNKHE